jgi:hypothetical protein
VNLQLHGADVSSDGCLFPYRNLDEAFLLGQAGQRGQRCQQSLEWSPLTDEDDPVIVKVCNPLVQTEHGIEIRKSHASAIEDPCALMSVELYTKTPRGALPATRQK